MMAKIALDRFVLYATAVGTPDPAALTARTVKRYVTPGSNWLNLSERVPAGTSVEKAPNPVLDVPSRLTWYLRTGDDPLLLGATQARVAEPFGTPDVVTERPVGAAGVPALGCRTKDDLVVDADVVVLTVIGPVIASGGTFTVIDPAELTVNAVAGTLLNVTPVTAAKPAPLIVTAVPTAPDVGAYRVNVGGGGLTVKEFTVVLAPPGVVTVIGPERAPTGTAVRIVEMAESGRPGAMVNIAGVLLNVTLVADARSSPEMVTGVPTTPDSG